MLEQERDLIAAELTALKAEMLQVSELSNARQGAWTDILSLRYHPALPRLQLQQTNHATEIALSDTQGENAKLRQAYMDICAEADALHAVSLVSPSPILAVVALHAHRLLAQDFNAALESGELLYPLLQFEVRNLRSLSLFPVHLAAQAEPSATGEYIELTSQLSQAVASRFEAEHQLRLYRRAVQAELEEKERWGALLRRHGLIS